MNTASDFSAGTSAGLGTALGTGQGTGAGTGYNKVGGIGQTTGTRCL